MKATRLLALILALSMLLVMAACGAKESPASDSPETEEPSSTQAPPADGADESAKPDDEPAEVLSYPIAGDYTLSMTSVTRMNTAEVLGTQNYSDLPSYDFVSEATGVEIEFHMLSEATYMENLNIMMASGDMPDIFSQSVSQYENDLKRGISDGVLIDINPYLEEHAPDFKAIVDSDQTFKEAIYNTDGTLSQFAGRVIPRVSQGLLIRGDWLEKLEMDAPTTLDELTEVLRAFNTEFDAKNAILVNREVDTGLTYFFDTMHMGFRGIEFQLTAPDSEEVVLNWASDGFVEYLSYLNSLFQQGIISDDFMSVAKELGNWESSYFSGLCGVWQDDCKYADPVYQSNSADPDWTAVPFALSGEYSHTVEKTVVAMAGKMYISTACEIPEIACQFINYVYTPEGMDLVAFGKEGVSYTTENGQISYTDLILDNPDGWNFDQANIVYTPAQWLPTDQQQVFLDMQYSPEAAEAYQLWTAEYGDDSMALPESVSMAAQGNEEFFSKAGDIITLFSEACAQFVVGELDEAGYRAVIETAYSSAGLDRMTEIQQAAYDDYLAAS